MSEQDFLDLLVVVADSHAESAIRTILSQRHKSVPMRAITFEIIRCPGNDPQARTKGPDFLCEYQKRAQHGLIVFDREGCGQESRTAEELEQELETRLGPIWGDRVAVVAIDPELEAWLWAGVSHIQQELGLSAEALRGVLGGFKQGQDGKPCRPKEAFQETLKRAQRPASAALYGKLAEKTGLKECRDRSFAKLKDCLSRWFPPADLTGSV
ncbi:MAG: hypothetical protein HPY44_03085 [Armatimonadetes bacterium]|nr:hypothetical protein [Armatimonadota bacterium]